LHRALGGDFLQRTDYSRGLDCRFPAIDEILGTVGNVATPVSRRGLGRGASGYLGVFPAGRSPARPWTAQIRFGKGGLKRAALGSWKTQREAAVAFDRAALYYRGVQARRNFPQVDLVPADAATLQREARVAMKIATASRFRGVRWDTRNGTWSPDELRREAYQERKIQSYTSRYRGVQYDTTRESRPWVAQIGGLRKLGIAYLGHWPSESRAAKVYDRAMRFYFGSGAWLNFSRPRAPCCGRTDFDRGSAKVEEGDLLQQVPRRHLGQESRSLARGDPILRPIDPPRRVPKRARCGRGVRREVNRSPRRSGQRELSPEDGQAGRRETCG